MHKPAKSLNDEFRDSVQRMFCPGSLTPPAYKGHAPGQNGDRAGREAWEAAVAKALGVVTSFVNPPIPHRGCDWSAHFDGDEEGRIGRGATEREAIEELLDTDLTVMFYAGYTAERAVAEIAGAVQS